MLKLIFKRILFGVVSLIATSFLIFWVNELIPGDFAPRRWAGDYSSEVGDVLREKLGLFQPLITRYLIWLGGMLTGDFGISWAGQEILPVIQVRTQRSLWLAILSAMVFFPVALALAILSVLNRYKKTDRAILVSNTIMLSTPEFFVGYAMMAIFAVKLEILPSLALVPDSAPLLVKLNASVLPVLTLSFAAIPPVMRIIRAALINTLNSEYIEMATLKGVSPLRILLFHALPNNIGAIANAVALGFAHLIAGIVIVEVVFVYPGMGSLFLGSIWSQDVPMILACGTILAGTYTILVMLADVIAIASNPKLISKTPDAYPSSGSGHSRIKICTGGFSNRISVIPVPVLAKDGARKLRVEIP